MAMPSTTCQETQRGQRGRTSAPSRAGSPTEDAAWLPFLTHKLILFRLLLIQVPSLSGPRPLLCAVFILPCGALSTPQTGFHPPGPVCSVSNVLGLEKAVILPHANFVRSVAPEHR